MPKIEIPGTILARLYKLHHKKKDVSRPYCIELESTSSKQTGYTHTTYDKISHKNLPGRMWVDNSSLKNSNASQCPNLKLEIMPEKCKHIPAIEFKNMWVVMYNSVSQLNQSATTEETKVARDLSSRLLHHKIMCKIDNDRITASLFTMLPNVDFEFYRVKPFPLRWNDSFTRMLENSQNNGRI